MIYLIIGVILVDIVAILFMSFIENVNPIHAAITTLSVNALITGAVLIIYGLKTINLK